MLEIYENLDLIDLIVGREKEVWKQVHTIDGLSEFRDYYFVSNFGRVKSTKGNDRIMKQTDNRGYLYVGLQTLDGKGKMMRVHRLVAFAFVSGWSEERNTVDHIFPDTKNNMVSNLQWLSRGDNIRKEQSKAVIGECLETGRTIRFSSIQDAGRCGFDQGAVSKVCRRERKTHKGYKWRYEEEEENVND